MRRPTLLEILDSKPVRIPLVIIFGIMWTLFVLAVVITIVATIVGYP